jgi:alcohol dehydrogenase class IV
VTAVTPAAFRYPLTGAITSRTGSVDLLGDVLDELALTRCLAVLTPSAARDRELVARLQERAGGRLEIFAGVRAHTPYEVVLAAARAAEAAGADGVVSVGGGTAIDTARLAGLCVAEGLRNPEQLHALRVVVGPAGPVFPLHAAHALPHVAVPTTLSSAEFSDGGAATCPWTARKELFAGPALACRAVLVDPALACATPADAWAMTGLRAIDHAVETLLSPRSSPQTDELSCQAIAHLRAALPAALAAPRDPEARARGQLGSWLSYFGVSAGTLGLSHAIGHQLGSRLGLAHGLASCVALPSVVRLVGPRAEGRARLVAHAFGADGGDAPDDEMPERAAAAIEALILSLGLPLRLSEADMATADAGELADAVLCDFLAGGAPGGPPTRLELIGLLESIA